MKSSFSFHRKWLDAINMIEDAAIRAEIISTVVNYGLTGELVRSESDVVNAMAALIISQISRGKNSSSAIPGKEASTVNDEPVTAKSQNSAPASTLSPAPTATSASARVATHVSSLYGNGAFMDADELRGYYPYSGYPEIMFLGETNESNAEARRKLVEERLSADVGDCALSQ